jgi:hypothetical protein
MAFIPLATTTTLQDFKAVVRMATGTVSVQESLLLEATLDEIVHASIVGVRSRLGPGLDEKYLTEAKSANGEIAEASNLIDISTLEIADVTRMSLLDATNGAIPFKRSEEFNGLKAIYSATMLANALFARVVNVLATNNKMQIETFRGMNVATAGALTLTYYRNPKKATAETTKLDLPEELIPIAEDVAIVKVFEFLKKSPPSDVGRRVTAFTGGEGA